MTNNSDDKSEEKIAEDATSHAVESVIDYSLTLKSELISLNNDVFSLYQNYGEVSKEAFINLERIALMHDVSESALIRLIEQVEASYIAQNLTHKSFVQWVKYLHVNFSIDNDFCSSLGKKEIEVNKALNTTGKPSEALLAILTSIEEKYKTINENDYSDSPVNNDDTVSSHSHKRGLSDNAKIKIIVVKRLVIFVFFLVGFYIAYGSLSDWLSEKGTSNQLLTDSVKGSENSLEDNLTDSAISNVTNNITEGENVDKVSSDSKQKTIKESIKVHSKESTTAFNRAKDRFLTIVKGKGSSNVEDAIVNNVGINSFSENNMSTKDSSAKAMSATSLNEVIAPTLLPEKESVRVNIQSTSQVTPLVNEKLKDKNQLPKSVQALESNWVRIPSGNFIFPIQKNNKRKQQHYLTSFDIMKTEVTFALWDSCVAAKACRNYPSDESWGRGNRPVINVHWNEITEQFIPWLHSVTGHYYYLPSETQWSYAASLVSSTPYHWGSKLGSDNANCANCGSQFDNSKTAPVKHFLANKLGVYDMHGNVWEFTQDCWSISLTKPHNNGSPWQNKACNTSVIKGGSYMATGNNLSIDTRNSVSRQTRNKGIGFRLIRAL